MTACLGENIIRPLSATEAYFWFSNQTAPKHFLIAGEVEGGTTLEAWRAALDALSARHPLLRVGVTTDDLGDPLFCSAPGSTIPLRVVSDTAPAQWEREAAKELATSFEPYEAPLARAVLLHEADRSTVILAIHHAIGDGVGATYLIRDLLQALSGAVLKPLELPAPQESLLDPRAPVDIAPPAPNTPGRRPDRDGVVPTLHRRRLDDGLSTRLRHQARAQGVTVHAALVAALILSGRAAYQPWSESPVRVVSPVNVRSLLGRNEDFGLSITFGAHGHDPAPDRDVDFWALAREVPAALDPLRSREGVTAFYTVLESIMAGHPGVAGVDEIERNAFAAEMMVSNLGVLPFEPQVGALRLSALWGPAVFVGMEGEQMIGVATLDDAIHLLHSSFAPIPPLLEGAEAWLRRVAAD